MPIQSVSVKVEIPLHHISISPEVQFKGLVYKDESCSPENVFGSDRVRDGEWGFVFIVREDRSEEKVSVAYYARARQWVLDGHGRFIGRNVAYVNPHPEKVRDVRLWLNYRLPMFIRHQLVFGLPR